MKIQLYFLLILFYSAAVSQTSKDIQQNGNLKNNPGLGNKLSLKSEALFRKENKIKTKKTFSLNNGIEVPLQVFKFDVNGNPIENISLDEKGGVKSRIVKEFNEKGILISIKSYDGNNKLLETSTKKLNEFGNEILNLTSSICFKSWWSKQVASLGRYGMQASLEKFNPEFLRLSSSGDSVP